MLSDAVYTNDVARKLVTFPFSRQVGRIRLAADGLRARQGDEANIYWRQLIVDMRLEMADAGIAQETIEPELRMFASSVFSAVAAENA